MEVIYVNTESIIKKQLNKKNCVMVLGYFDGVHLGHQEVIFSAKKIAQENNMKLSILSFFPHPKSILKKNFDNQCLEPLEDRIEKLENLGVDIFYIVEFNEKFSEIEADIFIEDYVIGLGARHIVCGFDYKYGHKAKGNRETLQAYKQRGIGIQVVNEEKYSEIKISSTAIRECLASGNVHNIPNYLGNHYSTKYCMKKGSLSHYKLPLSGKYKAIIQTENNRISSFVTIDSQMQLQFDCKLSAVEKTLKIFWLEKVS